MQNHHPVFKSQQSLLPISLFLLSSSLFGQQAAAIPVSNPNRVAILRWYGAHTAASFPVGQGPGQGSL
jgi:hypothetical protein